MAFGHWLSAFGKTIQRIVFCILLKADSYPALPITSTFRYDTEAL